MALGFGVVQLDVTAVNVAIRPITAGFGGPLAGGQWVVNAYTLTLASLLLSAGALGDRVGAKRVFVAGFALFTLASTGFARPSRILLEAQNRASICGEYTVQTRLRGQLQAASKPLRAGSKPLVLRSPRPMPRRRAGGRHVQGSC